MEDELFRYLDLYFETMENMNALRRTADETYKAWGGLCREAEAEEAKAASILKKVHEWKNGVVMKHRRQKYTGEAAPLPANVIPMEKGG
ncbi:MAG TPA: hypothetical protein PKN59_05890 [Syntrophales bacterium]|nr:hypothetical protein [Syntrophales bacterium]